ncbi:type I restriction enzyme [Streptococcus pneumoniae]|nr:type I restriction enzyme [Streptococcus pneumoniae]
MTPEQLKASILQRAMEGKLVPQNPNDEPASELLKRIKAEKEKLISEGKIKRDKKETEIFRGDDGKHYGKFAYGSTQEIDVPYDIPDTWEWVRFSTLVEIVRGGSPRPIKDYLTSEVDGINWIKIGDTEKGEKYINNVKEKIKKSGLNKTRFVKKGTFLLTNSMSFGRPYILNVDGAIHDGWLAISNYENSLNKDYLFYILSSNVVYSQFLSLISGAVVKNLNSDKVASILIPLPPLAEQQRIIEATLSLFKFFTPASELLKRIKAEKEKLISEGKIKRDKKETEIFRGDDGKHYGKFADGSTQEIDVPYDIPDTWEWVRIKSIYWNFGQNKPEKSFRYIDTSSIDRKKNIINYKNLQYLSPEQAPSRARKLVSQNSVLFSTVRPYLKNIAVVRELKEYLIASTAFIVLDTLLNETYLKYYLLSDNFINRVNNKSTGTSYPAINDYNFNLLLIALPPLSEQQRIVEAIESALEKVDEYAESYNRLEQLDKEFPDKLKKSILQYAMQGKLVEQDPNDESVEVLLEKIRAEKQKLFEEGKIKKKDLDISIVSQGDDNSYYGNKDETTSYPIYEIPEAWRYIKFASLVNFRIGKTPPRSEATFWGTEIPWVSISDMPISGYVTNTRESISKLALKSKKIDISPKGTLLMSFKLSIGKVAILDIPATHNEAIISIFPYANKENIIRDYLMIFLPLISTLGDSKDAIKGKTLNSTSISELLIPISNHEEMKRIISKVDLLFQKVSQLFE